jgi:hypothetical protein
MVFASDTATVAINESSSSADIVEERAPFGK